MGNARQLVTMLLYVMYQGVGNILAMAEETTLLVITYNQKTWWVSVFMPENLVS